MSWLSQVTSVRICTEKEIEREKDTEIEGGRKGAMEERGEGIVKSSFDSCETKLKKSPGR